MKRGLVCLCTLLCLFSTVACNKSEPVAENTEPQQEALLSESQYTEEMLSREEVKIDMSIENADAEVASKEQLKNNISLAYLIYSTRSVTTNKENPIIVSSYTQEDRDKLWEAYIIPGELDNYAASISNEGNSEYIIAILKPNENYKVKVYEGIKLLRSGYVGGFSDSHSLVPEATYIKQVKDYNVLCLCPDAEQIGTALVNKIEAMQE